MRKLAIAAAVSMSLATISVNTYALNLGEIEMYSALNQVLDAEINIVSFEPGDLDGVSAGLAPAEAFVSAGLQRTQTLSAMRFDVERRPDGVPVVKVTSDGPINEPFLSFLLQIDSPRSGRLIREYTVLLDPPVFVATQNELFSADPAVIESTEGLNNVGVSSAIERGVAPQDGLAIDLASELGGDTRVAGEEVLASAEEAPVVTYEIQMFNTADGSDTALVDSGGFALPDESLDDSDALGSSPDEIGGLVQNLDTPVRVGTSNNVSAEQNSGLLLDLAAELIDQTPEPAITAGGSEVQLDQLVGESNAIFDDEQPTNNDAIASLASDSASTSASDAVTGESIDVNAIVPDNSVGAISGAVASIETGEPIELDSDEFAPVVTVEREVRQTIPADSLGRNTPDDVLFTSNEVAPNSSATQVLGEAIDISGILTGASSSVETSDFSESPATTFTANAYRVRANDTLWSIARTQKASGVSTSRMVAAILQANPDAFDNGEVTRMRSGAELRIPASLASDDGVASTAIAAQEPAVTSEPAPVTDTLTIVGVDDSTNNDDVMASNGELTGVTDLNRELDEVNKRMMLAQEELTSESLQRDELNTRVAELEDSLVNMKKLITLRESELGNLQTELQSAEIETDNMAMEADKNARELEVSQAEKDAIQADLERMQNSINADASMAQERIDAQADADRNLASAEAEALSVRLASEEGALKSQLAQLQVEKAELIETAQNDKLALLQQSEAEKAQLLAEANAEQERIKAQLEAEKTRISEAAAAESARVAEAARIENQQLVAEANAERDRLAAESEALRTKLEALEVEREQLLADSEASKAQLAETTKQAKEDQSRLQAEAEAEKLRFEEESTQVKDRLAALQAEASANLSNATDQSAVVANEAMMDKTGEDADSDAAGMVKDDSMAGKGVAAASGLLAIAPLQRELGARNNILAAGGGLALLGLLGAWAMRRRRPAAVVKNDRDIPVDIDNIDRPIRAEFEEPETSRSTMGRAAVAASAAAAATGAAVSRDVSPAEQNKDSSVARIVDSAPTQDVPEADVPVLQERVQDSETPHQLVDNALLDDTITEADVYLRYGLHGQAEDLLVAAIEQAPDNEAYRLKLLENYHDQKNAEGFKAAAVNYKGRFSGSGHWERIAEMGRSIDPREGLYARSGFHDGDGGSQAVATGAIAAAAAATAVSQAGNSTANSTVSPANLDETIDAGAEFNVDDLAATGDFSQADDTFGIEDLDDISLDEVDLATLDDDGTLNLEEVTGNQMSGLDLGSLDLTDPDGDSTLDNLTLDDADLNSLGDVTSNLRSGMESDLDFSDDYGAESNEMETMLDLAKAYIDMGDSDSAASALKDIVSNGNEAQKKEAADLLKSLT